MRIITWNCGGGAFRNKAEKIAPLKPDILAVQEVEQLDSVLLFAGEPQPKYRDQVTRQKYPRRSVGMFSYTEMNLQVAHLPDPEMPWTYGFRTYETHRQDLMFHVAAVWTWKTKIKEDSYKQAHEGLGAHKKWIREHPTVVLGDFNTNASYQSNGWRTLKTLIDSLGLVSAYHHYFGEEFGVEKQATFFYQKSVKTRNTPGAEKRNGLQTWSALSYRICLPIKYSRMPAPSPLSCADCARSARRVSPSTNRPRASVSR